MVRIWFVPPPGWQRSMGVGQGGLCPFCESPQSCVVFRGSPRLWLAVVFLQFSQKLLELGRHCLMRRRVYVEAEGKAASSLINTYQLAQACGRG